MPASVIGLSEGGLKPPYDPGSGGSGGGSITFTDGTNTVTGATQLSVTGGTVGGATPNATLTIEDSASFTYWNFLDANANYSFSNLNLQATVPGSLISTWAGVRGNISHNSGKWYFEFKAPAIDGVNGVIFGVANASWALTSNALGAVDANGAGFQASGNVWYDGVAVLPGNSADYTAAEIAACAVDQGAGLIWFWSPATSQWNASASANPATGTGGFAITSLAAGTLFPALCVFNGSSADIGVINAGSSAFKRPGGLPAGFSAWGTPL
jgi:hypothetical protein